MNPFWPHLTFCQYFVLEYHPNHSNECINVGLVVWEVKKNRASGKITPLRRQHQMTSKRDRVLAFLEQDEYPPSVDQLAEDLRDPGLDYFRLVKMAKQWHGVLRVRGPRATLLPLAPAFHQLVLDYLAEEPHPQEPGLEDNPLVGHYASPTHALSTRETPGDDPLGASLDDAEDLAKAEGQAR